MDIEELRGLEFHQLTQKDQSVEQLGIQLQNLCKKAFPSVEPKDSDRLLKGRFFQALLPKWQRRLGAPKPSETLTDLYDRARTLERHDKQFADSASLRKVKPPSSKKTHVTTPPKYTPRQEDTLPPRGDNGKGYDPKSSKPITSIPKTCFRCKATDHLIKNCPKPRSGSGEAPGRSSSSSMVLTSPEPVQDTPLATIL